MDDVYTGDSHSRNSPSGRKSVYRFVPGSGDEGTRLDQFISAQSENISRTFVRKVVELGGVHVGGRRMRRCDLPVRAGELIEIFLDGGPLDVFSIRPDIVLYQDPYLIAIDKPSGTETQPTPARYKGTVYEALLRYLQSTPSRHRPPEIGMVQRLDRDTSGVMVFSTHVKAHRSMTATFSGRQAAKFYQAIVQGAPVSDEGEIRSLLARQRRTNLMRSVERGGKEAITRYRVLEKLPTATLLEVQILTGRSHQIRVHLAEAGHPLLGDTKYGSPSVHDGYSPVRLMLHSSRLVFPHPVSGSTLDFQAQLPAEMQDCLQRLRR